ncbi:MAG TPA: SgcJ/EcaC family oxidoreductase [Gemmatimonadales bacterium]|nr:SgcJ/EcaC family oxidoreductase [Gemmatimonadales bacterium]HRZ09205.1 SgcJ/EcaC family oxidoreductase [Gemmatimonadales bacterium]
MRSATLLGAVLLLAACSRAEVAKTAPASATVEELGQMNRDFAAALNAKDAALAASYYTEDAVVIPPGEAMVQGRAAIEAYWKAGIEQGGVRDASVETIKAESSGDIGYEIGTFVLTMNGPNGEPIQERGRYIELLKRGADGKWYSTAGIWNSAPPATP